MTSREKCKPSLQGWDAVVLLHGLFATRRSMLQAQKRLEQRGFIVINWGYPTLRRSIEDHAARLLPLLRMLAEEEQIRSISFLAHSFGGIIMRYALQREHIAKLHRAVMLAPPNTGTPLAKFSVGAFDRLFPIVRQLSEAPDSLPNRLPAPKGLEVGIVAASSDVVVRLQNTFLNCPHQHCVVPASHFELPHHEEALDKAERFLISGFFEPPHPSLALPTAA